MVIGLVDVDRMDNVTLQSAGNKLPPARDAVRSRKQMDSIRFGSIFLIMIHHFYHMQKPVGTVGTHFFFALTGFLVAMSLMKLREQVLSGVVTGWKAAYVFTTRRWMRVLPVMWIMLTCCFVLLTKSDRTHMLWHYALLSNIRMSLDGAYPAYIAHLWWISAIEQTLPFIILIFMLTPRHWLQRVLACLLIIGPAFRLIGYHLGWNYISMRVLPPAFIDIVGMGCLLAVAMKHGNLHLINLIKSIGLFVGVPMMFAALILIQTTQNDLYKSILFDIGSTWAVCALLIISYNGIGGPVGNILASPVLTYFGAISYGLAMWHLFAMAWMTKFFTDAPPHIRAAGSFVIATVFASVTYFLIERPVMRIKERITPKQTSKLQTSSGVSDVSMVELAKS